MTAGTRALIVRVLFTWISMGDELQWGKTVYGSQLSGGPWLHSDIATEEGLGRYVHARPYTQSNACAVVHFDARLLAVSVSKCASYTVMNHICRIMQMPQHVETLQATSASKRVRKSPFIYLITHSTICYHILLHVLFPCLFWMRVWLYVRGGVGGGGWHNGRKKQAAVAAFTTASR